MTGLLAAHAVGCCGRLALSCRLVSQLSFRWLGLAVLPGGHSKWQWLCRVSDMAVATYAATRSLWGLFVGPLSKVHAPWGMQHPSPWQEKEGPHVRSWHVEGSPSRLDSCWGLSVTLVICCVQRQADRAVQHLANSGGLLMVPRGGCTLPRVCTAISTCWD